MNGKAFYYTRPGLETLDGRVLSVEGEPAAQALVFEETIFYPEGGGQPCDLGTVGGIPLVSVEESDHGVLHRLASPLPQPPVPGQVLSLRLDGKRRRDHTEQHSGQHLLSATFLRLLAAQTRSFHLGSERSTIDIDCLPPPEADLSAVEEAVNEAIAADYRILVHLCPPEDVAGFTLRRLPPKAETIRIIEIDGIDFTPCCGTHARSTAELRLLLILGAEKYKGMTRVHFVVGERAVRQARISAKAAQEAGRILGCEAGAAGFEVSRQAERLKAAQSGRRGYLKAWAGLEAGIILGSPVPSGPLPLGGATGMDPLLVLDLADRDAEAALELAKALAGRGQASLVVSWPELTAIALSPAPGTGLDGLLGQACSRSGGSGGGGKAFFRAIFPNSAQLGGFLALVREIFQN